MSKEVVDVARAHRLDEMEVEAGLPGELLVHRKTIAGDRDETEALAVGSRADASGELVAVEPGQTDIHERSVRAHTKHQFHARGAIDRFVNLMAVDLEEHSQRLA